MIEVVKKSEKEVETVAFSEIKQGSAFLCEAFKGGGPFIKIWGGPQDRFINLAGDTWSGNYADNRVVPIKAEFHYSLP